MSMRGTITLECDTKRCHGSLDIEAKDWLDEAKEGKGGVEFEYYASGWHIDENGDLRCPQCCEPDERDEAYERAAARARNNDFAETGGKDWT